MYQITDPVKLSFEKSSFEIVSAILSADALFIAVATTAPSIATPPMALGNAAVLSSGETAAEYRRRNKCGINTKPRIRAICIRGIGNIDADLCSPAELLVLHAAIATRPVVIAESSEYLGYLAATGMPMPGDIYDLAVVTRVLYPLRTYGINVKALESEEYAAALKSKGHPCSLKKLAAACEWITPPSAAFKSGREWSLGYLGQDHADAIESRVSVLKQVFSFITGHSAFDKSVQSIRIRPGASEFFEGYQPATIRLARMHANGMPLSAAAADDTERTAMGAMPGLAQDLINSVPEVAHLADHLASVSNHASSEIRMAIGAHAASMGAGLPCDTDGLPKIGYEHIMRSGHGQTPGLVAWAALESCKRSYSGSADMRMHSRTGPNGRRIHPLTSIRAVTGRTGCKAVNAQGMEKSLKNLIEAREGCTLLELDFGAIEIRITAALCAQAMNAALDILSGKTGPAWVREALVWGSGAVDIQKPNRWSARDHVLAYWYQRAMRAGMPLVKLLQSGLCPHDYTSVGMAIRAAELEIPADLTRQAYMLAQPVGAIKKSLGHLRPAAKVMNFGLIYRMSAKGLHKKGLVDGVVWSEEDAREAHEAWFEQFPEVSFYIELELALSAQDDPVKMMIENRYESGFEVRDVEILESATLGGRPVVATDDRLMNYRSQGTGADILMRAIAGLPDAAAKSLCMVVHDSMVFEVLDEGIRAVADLAHSAMLRAANHYLGQWGIPCTVDVKMGKNWAEVR
jgi:hypothetical protein